MPELLDLLLRILEYNRDRLFMDNNRLWGAGNWVECARCPDYLGFPRFHHRDAHAYGDYG